MPLWSNVNSWTYSVWANRIIIKTAAKTTNNNAFLLYSYCVGHTPIVQVFWNRRFLMICLIYCCSCCCCCNCYRCSIHFDIFFAVLLAYIIFWMVWQWKASKCVLPHKFSHHSRTYNDPWISLPPNGEILFSGIIFRIWNSNKVLISFVCSYEVCFCFCCCCWKTSFRIPFLDWFHAECEQSIVLYEIVFNTRK